MYEYLYGLKHVIVPSRYGFHLCIFLSLLTWFATCFFQDIIEADPSLQRSDEEVSLLDSYALIRSNLVSNLTTFQLFHVNTQHVKTNVWHDMAQLDIEIALFMILG